MFKVRYLLKILGKIRRCKNNTLQFPSIKGGLPHSEIRGSKLIRSSPQLIAAYHVLHRLCMPRHPPNALLTLDRSHCQYRPLKARIGTFLSTCLRSTPNTRRHPASRNTPSVPKVECPKSCSTFWTSYSTESKDMSDQLLETCLVARGQATPIVTARKHRMPHTMQTSRSQSLHEDNQAPRRPVTRHTGTGKAPPASGHDLLFTMLTQQAPAKPAQTQLPTRMRFVCAHA